jgi:peptidyl-tRNA hydrolase (EC 3.1.1.29)
MRSIVAQLGTTEFPRLRVGIGQPPGKMDAADYVLSRFTPEEEAVLPDVLARVADAVDVILREGLITAMNRYNPL